MARPIDAEALEWKIQKRHDEFVQEKSDYAVGFRDGAFDALMLLRAAPNWADDTLAILSGDDQ